MDCHTCKIPMPLVDFYDLKAFHCAECLFERWFPDGTLQHCYMDMHTGDLTWRSREATTSASEVGK